MSSMHIYKHVYGTSSQHPGRKGVQKAEKLSTCPEHLTDTFRVGKTWSRSSLTMSILMQFGAIDLLEPLTTLQIYQTTKLYCFN